MEGVVRTLFEGKRKPGAEEVRAAGASMADVFSNVGPEQRLEIIARDWPKAQALAKRLAKNRGMPTDAVGSQLADGVAQALKFASEPQHWLHAGRAKRVLDRVGFRMEADYRAMTVSMRSPELGASMQRILGASLARHYEFQLDGRVGEWFASVQLFVKEHAGQAAVSPERARAYRDQRHRELLERVRRDHAEYQRVVVDLIAQIDGTTMAMFEPLPAADARTLRAQLLADQALVQSYVDELLGLMGVD